MLSRIHGDVDAAGARIDFAVNVVQTQPSWLLDALTHALPTLTAYPSAAQLKKVQQMIAHKHGLPADHVLVLCGAAEGFSLLPKLAPQHPVVIHPGFSEPDIALVDAGYKVERIVLDPPFHQLPPIPTSCDLVVIGNPTNPTGVLWTTTQLGELRAPGRIVVVDEAFLDVSGEEESMAQHVVDKDVVVLRSLTKSYGLAGLRVGYLLAAPELIEVLAHGRAHWAVGTLQMVAIEAVCSCGQPEKLREKIARDRDIMQRMLAEVGLQVATESKAPFVLVTGGDERVRQALLKEGIAVRRCDTFPGLGSEYWRLAVRDQQQVAALSEAYKRICCELSQD
ncbi:MAG: Rv2231c family pyridoxal phosphate-dependent protein CobC [Corynebacterium sp.]|uniref:Rv2231c family pyridoxal phosphate-dependent protein CobC n=1 Tax=Corynebacterium sp. TaxID=1720 RepID=UPI0026DD1272|nr:Rv2231c family pyridoxal phosphate-dependent protein CobC [Corynebacterium sp.]MDO4760919.1 Rv2231c family pyridoxal phosphate-dependent protein CobC [Corynebacterium sp.]